METPVYNKEGKQVGTAELSDGIFGLPWNAVLVQQILRAYRANARGNTAHTKDRGEVSGGGKKPWRQKGTGRARHGSTRSPIWIGGGVAHGPRNERNYEQKVNKRARRKALLVALSEKNRDSEIIVMEDTAMQAVKTKQAMGVFRALSTAGIERIGVKGGTALVAFASLNRDAARALRNLPYVRSCEARNLSSCQVMETKYIVLPQSSLAVLEQMITKSTPNDITTEAKQSHKIATSSAPADSPR